MEKTAERTSLVAAENDEFDAMFSGRRADPFAGGAMLDHDIGLRFDLLVDLFSGSLDQLLGPLVELGERCGVESDGTDSGTEWIAGEGTSSAYDVTLSTRTSSRSVTSRSAKAKASREGASSSTAIRTFIVTSTSAAPYPGPTWCKRCG